jgi:hypothetical protein
MDLNFQEVSATFREFYPDPSLRHRAHYGFAHQFLPQYVWQNPFAFFSYVYNRDNGCVPMEPTRFIQSRWSAIFEPLLNGPTAPRSAVFRRVSDLSMTIQPLDGKPSALIQMPLPEQPAEALFICIVLLAAVDNPSAWPRDSTARVFTLEAMQDKYSAGGTQAIICEWKPGPTHLNSGICIGPQRELFLQTIAQLLKANSPIAASTTFQQE